MIWLIGACLLGLVAFIALAIEDTRYHRALRDHDITS
ncbi:hypothetical protein GZL_06040 [Streptomyces sp. 769]|nr:hypothetical protein GZL_06040 [Streptomyces sp. 769]